MGQLKVDKRVSQGQSICQRQLMVNKRLVRELLGVQRKCTVKKCGLGCVRSEDNDARGRDKDYLRVDSIKLVVTFYFVLCTLRHTLVVFLPCIYIDQLNLPLNLSCLLLPRSC